MDNRIRPRPGRKVGAEKRRIARDVLVDYLMEHHEELPRKVVISMMELIGQTRLNKEELLKRRIYA